MAYKICMNNAQGAQVAKVHIDCQKNSLIGNHLKQFRNVHCILWHWLSSLSLVAMVVFPSRVGLIHTTKQIWNSLWNISTKNYMVTIFVLKTFSCTRCRWKLFTFNRSSPLSLLNGKNNGFTQIIDKKNTFLFISLILTSFYQGQIIILSAAPEDCPISGKICNIVINHLHLLSIDDDRKFVYIYSIFTSADWLLYSLYLQI